MNLSLTCNDIKICETNPYLVAYFVHDLVIYTFIKIYYFDLISETTKSKFPYIDDRINCGNLRKDGKLIFSGLNNGKILVHEANKKLCIRNYNFHKLQINSLEVSSNLTDILSSSNDLSIKIFNLSRNEPILSFDKAHSDYVKTAKYIDEYTIISGGSDKYIKLWDIRGVKINLI
jgi:WD40 repeat protein